MKWNPLCERCVKECKQDKSVSVVSCPAYESAEKNLELFDLKGNVRARAVAKKRRMTRKAPVKPESNDNGTPGM